MPELPEVEQVRISLLPHITGKTIEKVRVDLPKMILRIRELLSKSSREPGSPEWSAGENTCGWTWKKGTGC